jgi:hypothetical protein
MAQRGIAESEVEATLESPHTQYTDREGNPILIAHVAGRRIKVVIANGSSPPLVITVGD